MGEGPIKKSIADDFAKSLQAANSWIRPGMQSGDDEEKKKKARAALERRYKYVGGGSVTEEGGDS
jgi:hypothetical protein